MVVGFVVGESGEVVVVEPRGGLWDFPGPVVVVVVSAAVGAVVPCIVVVVGGTFVVAGVVATGAVPVGLAGGDAVVIDGRLATVGDVVRLSAVVGGASPANEEGGPSLGAVDVDVALVGPSDRLFDVMFGEPGVRSADGVPLLVIDQGPNKKAKVSPRPISANTETTRRAVLPKPTWSARAIADMEESGTP